MRFTKMQGAGNDFIVLNNRALKLPVSVFPDLARRLCARRVSLGANALMVADFPTGDGDLRMRFYNADGSEGEMCGNGARCLARYAWENGISTGETIRIETVAGPVLAWRVTKREYKIKLNDPGVLEPDRPVEALGAVWPCAYVELGDPGIPHAVVPIPGLAGKTEGELRPLGAALRSHPAFPKGANVNFYDIEPGGAVRELTYERGVEDFTLACGTGSGSTAAVLTLKGLLSGPVRLKVPGGELRVEVERDRERITGLYLIGDTNIVAEGELTDEDMVL